MKTRDLITCIVVVFFIGQLSVNSAFGGKKYSKKSYDTNNDKEEECESSNNYNLNYIANNINRKLPKKMSRISTWYKTSAEGCTLKHFYKFSFKKGRIPESKIRDKKATKMRRAACETESTRKMLSDGISVSYTYVGSNGRRITTIKVSNSDCQGG